MPLTIIERRICLESKFLDQNIIAHLLSKIQSSTTTDCIKDYGYILDVKRIVKILTHEICRANTDNVFTVQFEAQTLRPEINSIMTGKVCMVYKDGIFITVCDKQKILIPKINLKEYTFDESVPCYKNSEGHIIKNGDEITVVIIAVQYSKKNYSCFGSLKKE